MLSVLPSLAPGIYRHYKGGEYQVLDVVRHSESLEPMVLYRPLYNETGSWVRPFSMFFEAVEVDGKKVPRFALKQQLPGASKAELQATVARMELRLQSLAQEAPDWWSSYQQVARRFEDDLGASTRDAVLAKASALMLLQAIRGARGSG